MFASSKCPHISKYLAFPKRASMFLLLVFSTASKYWRAFLFLLSRR